MSREQKERHKRIVLIAGGFDKKLAYRDFARAVSRACKVAIFLPGSATRKMKSAIKNYKLELHDARTMADAVHKAAAHASPRDLVLLSPGAASFGLFINEFDRGRAFNRAVRSLK